MRWGSSLVILEAKPKNESMFDLPIPTDGAKLRSMAGAMIYIRVSTKATQWGLTNRRCQPLSLQAIGMLAISVTGRTRRMSSQVLPSRSSFRTEDASALRSNATARHPSPAFMSEGWWTYASTVGNLSAAGSGTWTSFDVLLNPERPQGIGIARPQRRHHTRNTKSP